MIDPEERFQRLFELHYHRVLGYALRRVDRREDAEDILAETFTIAWRRLDEVPPGSDARPWLYGVARRVLANHRRGTRRRARLVERLNVLSHPAASAEPGEPGTSAEVAAAFASLRPEDQEVLALLSWEELTPAEIAVVLGCSGGAARKRVHRARRRMSRKLSSETGRGGIARPADVRSTEAEEI